MLNLQLYAHGPNANYAGFPMVQPRNSQTGAAFEGYTVAPTPTPCMGPTVLADITDATTDCVHGQQLIAKALIAMAAGTGHTVDSRWPLSATPPVQIILEESNASYNFIEDAVRPTKFLGAPVGLLLAPTSFYYWKKNYLPTIVFRIDAVDGAWKQMIDTDHPNEA